jgi:hypothetical protein
MRDAGCERSVLLLEITESLEWDDLATIGAKISDLPQAMQNLAPIAVELSLPQCGQMTGVISSRPNRVTVGREIGILFSEPLMGFECPQKGHTSCFGSIFNPHRKQVRFCKF